MPIEPLRSAANATYKNKMPRVKKATQPNRTGNNLMNNKQPNAAASAARNPMLQRKNHDATATAPSKAIIASTVRMSLMCWCVPAKNVR